MTAIKRIIWPGKWIAVNQLDTIVLGMTKHQTIVQGKMTPAFG
jgi:hypothetical protein